MSAVSDFVSQYLPQAQAVSQKIGVDPHVILGQWGLETGWGKHVVAGTNNLGNIKGQGVAATDNQLGSTDQYKAYASPMQFADDFTQLVSNKYPKAVGAGPDAQAYGSVLQKGGYAEDKNYSSKLAAATKAVRDSQGVDIDPSQVKWDSPSASSANIGNPSGSGINPQIDASQVTWDKPQASAKNGGKTPAPAVDDEYNPVAGNNFLQNALIGTGKGFYDIAHGLRQLGAEGVNLVAPSLVSDDYVKGLRKDYDQEKARDTYINATTGGKVGQVVANVATLAVPGGALAKIGQAGRAVEGANLLTKALNPATLRTAATLGAAQGASQQVGTDDSRLFNTGVGAAAGTLGSIFTPLITKPVAILAERSGLGQKVVQQLASTVGNAGSGAAVGAAQGAVTTPTDENGNIQYGAAAKNALEGALYGGATGAALHTAQGAGAEYLQPKVNRLKSALGLSSDQPATPQTENAATITATQAANDASAAKPRYRVAPDGTLSKVEPQATGQDQGASAKQESASGQSSSGATSQTNAGNTARKASPELQSVIDRAGDNINHGALTRHLEAESLPIPMRLSAGQATGDADQISFEQNHRGIGKDMVPFLQQQNKDLIANFDAIRDNAAPDVTSTNDTEHGQALIDSYKAKDAELRADINQKYQDLRDANGGAFPIDGQTFVQNARAALDHEMKDGYVPTEIQKALNKFSDPNNQMSFKDFENLRSNLADESRKADRAGDGSTVRAVGIIRDSLEQLPMTNETAQLKPLADAARSAAKARFDLIKKDPAYKAVANDETTVGETSPLADKFVQKYVIGGSKAALENMQRNLANDPKAAQTISASAIDYLKRASGIKGNSNEGNVTQNGLNKAMSNLAGKNDVLFDPQTMQYLNTLGNVARYTQFQPKGSYVNNSGTLVGAISDKVGGAAAAAANAAVPGAGVGTMAKNFLDRRAMAKALREATQTGAGITNR